MAAITDFIRTHHRAWVLSTGLFVCALSGTASADPAAEARFHDDLARQRYGAGDFEGAAREFFIEQRVAPNPRITFNLAVCFEQLHRDDDAYLYFSEYLGSDDQDKERREHADATVKRLEKRIARVLVKSTPPGADILVDQKEHGSYGKAPRVIAVSPGEHHIWAELSGFRPAETTVSVKKGEAVEVALAPVQIVGTLKVASAVPGQVEVRTPGGDTVAQGATPLTASVPVGPYQITVRAKGYLPWTGLTNVEADASVETTATLQVSPAETGDITVTSNVPGALVELDGQPVGFSPTVLSGIAAGAHQLRARAPSVLSWSGKIDVAAEQREWVTLALEKPTKVQHSSATWVVGGLGVASLCASGVFGLLAANAHRDFETASLDADRAALRDRGITMNTAADVLLVTGAVALAAGVVLYFTSAEARQRESSAAIARSAR